MSQRYGDQSGAESTDCVPTCCVQDQNGSSGTNRTANKHSAHEDRVQSVPRFGPKRINHLGGHDAAQPPGQRDHHDLGGGLNAGDFVLAGREAAIKQLWLLAYREAQVETFADAYLAIAMCFTVAVVMVPLMHKVAPPKSPSPDAH